MTVGARCLVVLVVVSLSGCSFLMVDRTPAPERPGGPPACANRVPPTIDLVMTPVWLTLGVLQVVSPGRGFGEIDGPHRAQGEHIVAAALMGGLSLTSLISSVYGYKTVGACRRTLAAK